MTIKSFEIAKIDLKNKRFFLLYGANEGHKNEVIENNFKKKYLEKTYYYDENEILNNQDNFFNEILSKSFFESEKLIIVNRASDKIKKIILIV